MRSRQTGMSLIELMVALAVLAIIVKIALPNFSSTIQSGRVQAAADGFRRVVAQARDVAAQSGKRATLTVNGTVSGCGDAAWSVTQAGTVKICLTKADFAKRYEGVVLGGDCDNLTTEFGPSGVGGTIMKGGSQVLDSGGAAVPANCSLSGGGASKSLKVYAGGAVDVQ